MTMIEATVSRKRNFRREPNGRRQRGSQQERVQDVISVVVAQPHRRNLKDPADWRAESQIGLLRLLKVIDHGFAGF